MDNLFRSKRKRIFELNPYNDKAGSRTKCTIHITASIRGKAIKKRPEEKVQLAINLELKTLQIVRFALSNSNTLQQGL